MQILASKCTKKQHNYKTSCRIGNLKGKSSICEWVQQILNDRTPRLRAFQHSPDLTFLSWYTLLTVADVASCGAIRMNMAQIRLV